jgi:spore maturation protein SpmB
VLCFITPYTIGFDVTASEHGALGVITDFLHTLSLHAFHCLVAFLWSLNCGEALQQLAVALML